MKQRQYIHTSVFAISISFCRDSFSCSSLLTWVFNTLIIVFPSAHSLFNRSDSCLFSSSSFRAESFVCFTSSSWACSWLYVCTGSGKPQIQAFSPQHLSLAVLTPTFSLFSFIPGNSIQVMCKVLYSDSSLILYIYIAQ